MRSLNAKSPFEFGAFSAVSPARSLNIAQCGIKLSVPHFISHCLISPVRRGLVGTSADY